MNNAPGTATPITVKELVAHLLQLDGDLPVVVLEHCCGGCYGEHTNAVTAAIKEGEWSSDGISFYPDRSPFTQAKIRNFGQAVIISSAQD